MFKRIALLALATSLAWACGNSGPAPSPSEGSGGATNTTGGASGVGGGSFSGGIDGAGGTGATAGGGAPGSGGASTGAAGPGGTSSTGGALFGSGGAESPSSGGTSSGGTSGSGGEGTGGAATLEWLPSWATSIQTTEPDNNPPMALSGNTARQFVWPTVSGSEIRIQLSNEKGSTDVEMSKVHIATAAPPGSGAILAETDAQFTFGGMANVTIPAGQTVWSDSLSFSLEAFQLTAISIQFGTAVPAAITGHPGARTKTYVASGDQVSAASLSGAQNKPRWYFINAIEVMAPANAHAIAILGDSITDGYGVVEDTFTRWPDFLSQKLHTVSSFSAPRAVLNFGMGANNLTVTTEYQDAGTVRFQRDVLTRPKIKWLIVLEGINDIVYSNVGEQALKDAYDEIIEQAHDAGILVYGVPILPTNQGSASIRNNVNTYIRESANFDAVIELDKILDPGGAGVISDAYDNDGLHPNTAGYEAMGNAVPVELFADSTLQ